MTLTERYEARKTALATMIKKQDDLKDEKRTWTADDESEWEQASTDYDRHGRAIEIEERTQAAVKAANGGFDQPDEPRGGGDDDNQVEQRALAFGAWFTVNAGGDMSVEQRTACDALSFNPGRNRLEFAISPATVYEEVAMRMRSRHPDSATMIAREYFEKRAMSSQIGASGGFLVPDSFINRVEAAMLAFGGILQVATIFNTNSGSPLPLPTINDTGNTGEMIGESGSVGTTSTDPSIGQITLNAWKFSSKPVHIPTELIEDSPFDIAARVGDWLGERIGRIINTKMTVGTGGAEPEGIVNGATLGKTAAAAAAIDPKEIIDLAHSVDPSYRGNARFMLHDSVLSAVRKLQTTDGQFLWMPGLQAGVPDTLYGKPITINQDMESTLATGNKVILFGDLSKYNVRQVRGIRVHRWTRDENDQEAFVAYVRADGAVIDAGTNPIKYLQMA